MKRFGAAIKEVLHFKTLGGRFNSVHSDLKEEGITGIQIGDMGITFLRD